MIAEDEPMHSRVCPGCGGLFQGQGFLAEQTVQSLLSLHLAICPGLPAALDDALERILTES